MCILTSACVAEDTEEHGGLELARSLVGDLIQFVDDEICEQQNWRKTLNIYLRLDKRPIEESTHPVLVELRVGPADCFHCWFRCLCC